MSWVITGSQKIDSDAAVYLSRVEAADGQALEAGVRTAVDQFVLGCKADGIWPAIKASCILSGARTLTGALVPLAGTAPTNVSFVSGDYNRKTGLNSGTSKSLNSNRNNNADPQNSKHLSVYATITATTLNQGYITTSFGTGFTAINTENSLLVTGIINSTAGAGLSVPHSVGFIGMNRSGANAQQARGGGVTNANTLVSETPRNENLALFSGTLMRLAFYSIGESLNLALLDARVTTLINAFGVAIP